MKSTSFAEGLIVEYRQMVGTIRFISEKYLTICICTFPEERSKDVCILVYRGQWDEIKLFKESNK